MTNDELRKLLAEWTTATRLDDARSIRSARRWHDQLAAESSTLSGLLVDLYDSATEGRIATANGREHIGKVSMLGADFVALESPTRPTVLLPIVAVASIQVEQTPRQLGSIGDRSLPEGPEFAEVLTRLAPDRPKIRFATAGNDTMRGGELVAVGDDIMTVALDTPPDQTLIVPVNQIGELTVI